MPTSCRICPATPVCDGTVPEGELSPGRLVSLTRFFLTPYEYAHVLAEAVPEQAVTIERLGDLYVRDRWADPSSAEHPRHNGEIDEIPRMWKILQPRLFIYLARHPHFLRWLPNKVGTFISKRWASRRKRRSDDDLSRLE